VTLGDALLCEVGRPLFGKEHDEDRRLVSLRCDYHGIDMAMGVGRIAAVGVVLPPKKLAWLRSRSFGFSNIETNLSLDGAEAGRCPADPPSSFAVLALAWIAVAHATATSRRGLERRTKLILSDRRRMISKSPSLPGPERDRIGPRRPASGGELELVSRFKSGG